MYGLSPISPTGGWGVQKPPCGVGIERGDPLAARLRFFVPFNERSGLRADDAVSGRSTIAGYTLIDPWRPRPGWLNLDGTDGRAVFPGIMPLTPSMPWTFATEFRFTTTATQYLFAIETAAAAPGLYFPINGSNQIAASWSASAGNALSRRSSSGIAINTDHILVVTYDGSSLAAGLHIYLNGAEVAYDTNLDAGTLNAIPGNWTVGGYTGAMNRTLYGSIRWCLFALGVMSSGDIQRLRAGPFCMFQAGRPLAADARARAPIDGSLASDTPLLGAVA